MGKDNKRCLDIGNFRERLLPRVRTRSTIRERTDQSLEQILCSPTRGNATSTRKRCHRTGSSVRKEPGLLCTCLPPSEKVGSHAHDNEPKTSKQASNIQAFQNGPPRCNLKGFDTRSLGHFNRSNRRLLTHSPAAKSQEICQSSGWESTFSVCEPMFRPIIGTTHLHENYGGSGSMDETIRSQNDSVPRRLVTDQRRSNTLVETKRPITFKDQDIGTLNQHREISTSTNSNDLLPRRSTRSETRSGWNSSRETRENQTLCNRINDSRELHSQTISRIAGSHGILHWDSAMGAATHATTTTLSVSQMAHEQQKHSTSSTNSGTFDSSPTLVDTGSKSLASSTITTTNSFNSDQHGRKSLGLGRLHRGFLEHDTRSMELTRDRASHQLVRDESCVFDSPNFHRFSCEEVCVGSVRQLHSSKLHKSRGRDEISETVLPRLGSAPMVPGQEHESQSGSHCRSKEHTSRHAQQIKSPPLRMESTSECILTNTRINIPTNDRSICIPAKQPTTSVLLLEPGSSGSPGRRIDNGLGQSARVCISAHPTYSGNIEENRNLTLQSSTHCSQVAEEIVVSTDTQAIIHDTSRAATTAESTVTTEGSSPTSQSRDPQPGGMAAIRQDLRSQGFSRAAAKLIAGSIRKSTHTVYRSRYREFVSWCHRRDIHPSKAPIIKVANFLACLFKKGLSYSSICGYRSAISAYHEGLDGIRLGEHPKLIKLLKGVFNKRPPVKLLASTWSLDKVLKCLKVHPFEPLTEVSFKWLSLKVAFLLGICSAARCSDLARFSYQEPYLRFVNSSEGIRLIPKTLKKQCRPGHLLQETFIPKYHIRLLDPVRALKIYLQRVKNHRKGDGLLVTFGKGKRLGKSASSQTISKWIRQTISTTHPNLETIRSHSTRGVSATVALTKGVSLEAILKAADWSSSSTFAQHYLAASVAEEGAFGRSVLDN